MQPPQQRNLDAAAALPSADLHYEITPAAPHSSAIQNLETRMMKDNGTAHEAISLKNFEATQIQLEA